MLGRRILKSMSSTANALSRSSTGMSASSAGTDSSLTSFPTSGILSKDITTALPFLKRFPKFDGTGVVVGILDTGVDSLARGLDAPGKVIGMVDCTGSGDVRCSKASVVVEGGANCLKTVSFTGPQRFAPPSLQFESRCYSHPSRIPSAGREC